MDSTTGLDAHVNTFFLTECMEMSMFHVRFWKVFHARYGDISPTGKKISDLLFMAQDYHFKHEECGVLITEEILKNIHQKFNYNTATRNCFPSRPDGTEQCDVIDADFVSKNCCVTMSLLNNFRDTGVTLNQLKSYVKSRNKSAISSTAHKLQQANDDKLFDNSLSESYMDTSDDDYTYSEEYLATQEIKVLFRKEWNDIFDSVANSHRVSKCQLKKFVESCNEIRNDLMNNVTEDQKMEAF